MNLLHMGTVVQLVLLFKVQSREMNGIKPVNSGGTTCEDPPGIREGMGMKLYLAYLRNPSGNKLCALLNL